MSTKENILNDIKLKAYRTQNNAYDSQYEWKKNKIKLNCALTYKNKGYRFNFWMNSENKRKVNKKDVIYCLLAEDVTGMDYNDFCDNFGYNKDSKEAIRIYKDCNKQTRILNQLFNETEKEMLRDLLQDY